MKRLYASARGAFSAAHFYHQKQWDLKANEAEFGLCFSKYGHGHNYSLDVTYSVPYEIAVNEGEYDEVLQNIKSLIIVVLKDFDHHHLNFTHPAFNTNQRISTTEVLSEVIEKSILKLWQKSKLVSAKFHGVQVWETNLLAAATEKSILSLARAKPAWSSTKLHHSVRLSTGECISIEVTVPPPVSSKAADFLDSTDRQFVSLEALCCALQEHVDQPVLMSTKSDYFLLAGAADASAAYV
jgi:6-pyruvoyltetrahydropterin/6-carboxytetrahydropterin synthase